MRNAIVVLWMWLGAVTAAIAQVSIGIGMPNVSIGINLPVYPDLVQVPNYPVYYAPRLNTNYFFYDGLYWVYEQDDWYASSWYNGPWGRVAPDGVPLFILRIPVRYYRQPPVYFRGWRPDAPPRWGEHWGGDWQQRRPGWDRWDRRVAPRPAPLPLYQRQYTGERYPSAVERQQALHGQNYRYQPRERIIQQHEQRQPPSQSDQNRQQQRTTRRVRRPRRSSDSATIATTIAAGAVANRAIRATSATGVTRVTGVTRATSVAGAARSSVTAQASCQTHA
jgi:hypothetical protein